jgi:tetratricopeptide (TPR) repeat protein
LDIADDCLDYQPDLLVCYMGNNEVVGPYGAGTVFSSSTLNLHLIRFINSIKSLRIAQILTTTLEKTGLKEDPVSHWKGMEMFLEKQVRFDDQALKQVYSNFEGNLQKMYKMAERKGVKLISCTTGSNLKDSPPFSSLHKQDLSDEDGDDWNSLYKQGVSLESDGKFQEAIQMYLAAAKIDSVFADLQFRLGQCYLQLGEYEKSKERYKLALLFDTNRFRSDKHIIEIIRDVFFKNNSSNVYLVDAWDIFKDNSPHGITGNELFLEHVHLNFHGNYLLAKSVFDQINMILPQKVIQNTKSNFILTDSLIAGDLVFSELANYQINESVLNDYVKKPPFTNQLYHNETVDEMQAIIDAFRNKINQDMFDKINDEYQKAIQSNPTDWMLHWKYAGLLASTDLLNDKDAAKHYQYVVNALPHYPGAYVLLGLVTGRLGRFSESVSLNKKALQMDPTLAEAWFNLGLISQIKKQPEQALEYYHKTLYYKPEHQRAYNNISVIYYNQGNYSNAIKILREGLVYLPEDIELHYKLAYMLNLSGKMDEAILVLSKALKIDPGNKKIQKILNGLTKMK